jgi:DNA-directed RNA polymerase subunit RPC12/RpoP
MQCKYCVMPAPLPLPGIQILNAQAVPLPSFTALHCDINGSGSNDLLRCNQCGEEFEIMAGLKYVFCPVCSSCGFVEGRQ